MAFFKHKQDVKTTIYAPVDGKVIPLEEVSDPVFSEKMMGDGAAIVANGEYIYAPIDGEITLIADTKHAFGIIGTNGVELIVHVGLETVHLQGEGFEVLTKVGSKVKQGSPILKVDLNFMKEKNISLTTPIIVLNHWDHPVHSEDAPDTVNGGKDVLYTVS